MNKSDLKIGDIVVYNNGIVRMFLGDNILVGAEGHTKLSCYDERLVSNDQIHANLNIDKVYRASGFTLGNLKLREFEEECEFGHYELVWNRATNPSYLKLKYLSVKVFPDGSMDVGGCPINHDDIELLYKTYKEQKERNEETTN